MEASREDHLTEQLSKGERSRQRLLDSARRVFESDGYAEARISDIATDAGMAVGSFYTYFESKEEIFFELAKQVFQGMFPGSHGRSSRAESDIPEPLTERDAFESIARTNRHFVEFYRVNRLINATFESAATYVPEIKSFRTEIRHASVTRATASIMNLQKNGLVDSRLDPGITAAILVSMVSNFVYFYFVFDESFSIDLAVDHLNMIWARALGLSVPDTELA